MLEDVHIEQLRKGESAPDFLPLTIMQAKVYCDEELSVFLDVDDDFDHADEKRFFKVLADEPKFVDQLFSSQRAILCYAVRRRDKDWS